MRLLRFFKRALLVLVLGAIALVAGVSVYFRIEQYRFRKQAERLLDDVRGLELKKASAAEVRRVIARWGFEEFGVEGWHPSSCPPGNCIYYLRLKPKPVGLHTLPDPFVAPPTVRIFEWLGLRPKIVEAWVHMQGDTLYSTSLSVYTVGRGCDWSGCTIVAVAGTRAESSWSDHDRPESKLRHSLLHPSYLVGAFPTMFNVDTGGSPAMVIWAEFSRDATAADVSRLMQFDLSCLTRLRSCIVRDLMPTVWEQTVEDSRAPAAALMCTTELSKRVAQLADDVAVVRPKTIELSPPRYEGLPPQLPHVEIVSIIKKSKYSRLGKGLEANVDVDSPEVTTTADTQSPIRAGQQYVFLLQHHHDPVHSSMALYPCGILTLNDANLAMVREAAANGAD
jgi:hypothetical protein